ncbi:MAG: hypothetical protein EP329_01850 [Deltaproteobacteria bacterium]|nr:MAG: hypothetical protein EP329_01850 [Deltaproteobacteria bacterium]
MGDGGQSVERGGPKIALVGGWLAGVASGLFAVAMVIGAMKPEREWGIIGGLYELRVGIFAALAAWVAGVVCFALGWIALRADRPLALAAGVLWLVLAATALMVTLIGFTGGNVSWLLVVGLVLMLVTYAVTAVALKALLGQEPGGPGVWGFSLAAAFMILAVLAAFIQMPLVFVSAIGLVWVGAAIGFIGTGMALAGRSRAG